MSEQPVNEAGWLVESADWKWVSKHVTLQEAFAEALDVLEPESIGQLACFTPVGVKPTDENVYWARTDLMLQALGRWGGEP